MKELIYTKITEAGILSPHFLDYIPMEQKRVFVATNALRGAALVEGDGVPNLYIRDTIKIQKLFAMAQELYTGKNTDFAKADDATYDLWAKDGTLMEQIQVIYETTENPIVREKCRRILNDYKRLAWMLDEQITDSVRAANDPIRRLKETIESQTTPEYVKSLMESIRATQEALNAIKANN